MNDKTITAKDYIITLIIIIVSAILFDTTILAKYLSIWYLAKVNNLYFVLLSFSQIIIPVIIWFLYLYIKNIKYINQEIKDMLKNINWKIIIVWYIIVLAIWFIYSRIIWILWFKTSENIFTEFAKSGNILLLSIFTILWVFAAIYEEIIFRWILFDLFLGWFNKIKLFAKSSTKIYINDSSKIKSKMNVSSLREYKKKITIPVILTIIITALLFWFMHMQYWVILIINVILIWLIFGYLKYKYWIIHTIIIHMINNFVIIFFTMLLPTVLAHLNHTIFNRDQNQVNLTKLKYNLDNEENIFLKQILRWQVITNKWLTNNKQIDRVLKDSKENLYNPYIYKYFFMPDWDYTKCIISQKYKSSKWCKDWAKKLLLKFTNYEKLYKLGLIQKYQFKHIQEFIKFINIMFFK